MLYSSDSIVCPDVGIGRQDGLKIRWPLVVRVQVPLRVQIQEWQRGLMLSIHRVWECGMYDTYTRGLAGSNPVSCTYIGVAEA